MKALSIILIAIFVVTVSAHKPRPNKEPSDDDHSVLRLKIDAIAEIVRSPAEEASHRPGGQPPHHHTHRPPRPPPSGRPTHPPHPPPTGRPTRPPPSDRPTRPTPSDRPTRPTPSDRPTRPPPSDRPTRPTPSDRPTRPPPSDRPTRPRPPSRPEQPASDLPSSSYPSSNSRPQIPEDYKIAFTNSKSDSNQQAGYSPEDSVRKMSEQQRVEENNGEPIFI